MDNKDAMKGNNEYPRLLKNNPCSEDLFEGKAHENLAESIAETIRNNQDCVCIGIEGGWGTGKSNVVRLVEKNLNSKLSGGKGYHFFIYDAWGHQNDYQKRSILEELIADLVRKKEKSILKDVSKWNEKLAKLLSRRREVRRQVVPQLSVSAIIGLFMVISTPVLSILSMYFRNSYFGWILPVIFYTICIGVAIGYSWKQWKRISNIDGKKIRFVVYLIQIYNDEIKSDTTYEQISEREPSSVQFKQWMHELDSSICENKTLIVVFDNMDRLPKKKVQELWAAIHNVFSEEKYLNIKTIIPFDRTHIQCAFQAEDINCIDASNPQDKTEQQKISFGDDFINKTFDVVYRVSPPILSGWENYFRLQWENAFGHESQVDNSVLQIYDLLTGNQTPRKIIAFINEFVTIKKTAEIQIEDKYIALFIFGKHKIEQNPYEEILAPTYLGALDYLYGGDSRMQECISALYYQLPLQDAMDVVYTRKVLRELNENQTTILEKLNGSVRLAILNRVIAQISNLKNTVLALGKVLVAEDAGEQGIWDALYWKVMQEMWLSARYEDYHQVLLSHVSDKEQLFVHMVELYQQGLREKAVTIEKYIDGIDELKKVLKSEGDKFLEETKFNITPQDFIQVLAKKNTKINCYAIDVDETELNEYLMELKEDGIAQLPNLSPLKNFNLEKFSTRLRELIEQYSGDIEIERELFKHLYAVAKTKPIGNISNLLSFDSVCTMAQEINNVQDEFYIQLYCMYVYFRYKLNKEARVNPFGIIEKSEDDGVVRNIAERVEWFISYGDILLSLEKYGSDEMLKKVAAELTRNSYGTSRLSLDSVLMQFDKIVEIGGIDPEMLINRLNCWTKHIKEKNDFNIIEVPLLFFDTAVKVKNDLSEYCLLMLKQYFETLDQAVWEERLRNHAKEVELLKIYHPILFSHYTDALKSILRTYALGEKEQPFEKDYLDELVDISQGMAFPLERIFVDIRDVLIGQTSITTEKILFFGELLFDYAKLEEVADKISKILPTDQIDADVVKMLMGRQAEFARIIAVVSEKEKATLSDKFHSLKLSDFPEDDVYQAFCNATGMGSQDDITEKEKKEE